MYCTEPIASVFRTQLAILHYNENSQREQARTKDGTPRWLVRYPKATGGEAVACPIMEPASHGKLAVYGFFLRRNNNAPNFYAGYVTKLLGAVVAAAVNVPPGKKKHSGRKATTQ